MKSDRENIIILMEQVNEIRTNHLPHLQAQINEFKIFYFSNHKELADKVDSISKQQAYYSGGLAVLIVVIDILLKLWK